MIRESYVAKDIKALLGISPGQLFHWGKTWRLISPEVKSAGRQGKDKYSFMNLLRLSLIKELVGLGIELSQIQNFLASWPDKKDIF